MLRNIQFRGNEDGNFFGRKFKINSNKSYILIHYQNFNVTQLMKTKWHEKKHDNEKSGFAIHASLYALIFWTFLIVTINQCV